MEELQRAHIEMTYLTYFNHQISSLSYYSQVRPRREIENLKPLKASEVKQSQSNWSFSNPLSLLLYHFLTINNIS